jgi:hypothetical protein
VKIRSKFSAAFIVPIVTKLPVTQESFAKNQANFSEKKYWQHITYAR